MALSVRQREGGRGPTLLFLLLKLDWLLGWIKVKVANYLQLKGSPSQHSSKGETKSADRSEFVFPSKFFNKSIRVSSYI